MESLYKVSASGKFEIWGQIIVEGDSFSRGTVQWLRLFTSETFDGLEKFDDDIECGAIECRFPANFVKRHTKLAQMKAEQNSWQYETVVDPNVPF